MIRKANETDLKRISEIYLSIIKKEAVEGGQTEWKENVYPTYDTAKLALKRNDIYVYEENGSILATAIINHIQMDSYKDGGWKLDAPDDKILVIHTLAVDPAFAKRGIGKKFIEFYENLAREMHISSLRLDTNEKNYSARAFYKKLGYEEVNIVNTTFNGIPNYHLVLLEKVL